MSRELQLLTIHTVIPRIDSRGQLSRPSCMSPGAFTTFWGCELEGLARVNNAHSLRTCLTHPRIPLLTEDSECDFRLWGACPQGIMGRWPFPLCFSYFGYGVKDYRLCVSLAKEIDCSFPRSSDLSQAAWLLFPLSYKGCHYIDFKN